MNIALERAIRNNESLREAYLGTGLHVDSAWFHAVVDRVSAHAQDGDVVASLLMVLAEINLQKAVATREAILRRQLAIEQPFIR